MCRNTFLLYVWLINPSKLMIFLCNGALFLWQVQHFMNIGSHSNTGAMATIARFLLKITANLIDKICYYALHINEPSLNDSKKLSFLTLFKCVLVNLLQNVVRSLRSAGGPYIRYLQTELWIGIFIGDLLKMDGATHEAWRKDPQSKSNVQPLAPVNSR